MKTTFVPVCSDCEEITGTSAELVCGDQLTIWDLLHGLLLPSGNDAAFLLADYFGSLLLEANRFLESYEGFKKIPFLSKYSDWKNHTSVRAFLQEMNRQAHSMELKGSLFDSPHGLCNIHNKSSAFDISKIMCKLAHYPLF